MGTTPARRRIVATFLSILFFVTAPALVFLRYVSLLGIAELTQFGPAYWARLVVHSFLELFPNPRNIGGFLALQRHGVLHDFMGSRAFTFGFTPALIVACLVLGWGVLKQREWARWAVVASCGLKIVLVIADILVNREQFTYCLEGTIYRCGQNTFEQLLPHYGFSVAGALISAALAVFLWRYGLTQTGAGTGIQPSAPPDVGGRQNSVSMLRVQRWVVIVFSFLLIVQYAFALMFFFSFNHRPDRVEMAAFAELVFVAIVSYVFIVIRLIRRADVIAFALATSTGVCILFARAVIWAHNPYFPISFFSGFGSWILSYYSRALYGYADVMYALHLLISVVALQAIWRMQSQRRAAPGKLSFALMMPLVIVLFWPQIQFLQKSYMDLPVAFQSSPEAKAQNRRYEAALKKVQAFGLCAFRYKQSHPARGFPDFSEITADNGCLSTEQANGRLDGYEFHYSASQPDAGGARRAFAAVALPIPTNDPHAEPFYMDETGLLSKPVPRPAIQGVANSGLSPTASSPVFERGSLVNSFGYKMNLFHSCLAQIAARDSARQFPVTLEPLLKEKASYGCITPYDLAYFSSSDLRANHLAFGKYVFDYAPIVDSSHRATSYVMTAKPEHYIEDGMRSYFIDQTGVLRATPDNRLAAAFDSEALPCEVTFQPCTDPILFEWIFQR